MTKAWWEAPMGGSVLSFLKAEWKVSDTGSVGWASSSLLHEIHTTYSLVRPSLFSYDSSCEYFLYKRLNLLATFLSASFQDYHISKKKKKSCFPHTEFEIWK